MISTRRSSWACTGRAEYRSLLVQAAHDPLGNARDLLSAEDAHDLVDLGELIEQNILLALGQATGDNDPLTCPARLRTSNSSITPHDSCLAASMNPQVLTKTRSDSCPSGTSTNPS